MVSIQVVATPTSGRARSSSVNPIALSIARAGARSGPSVSVDERRLAGSVGRSYGPWPFDETSLKSESSRAVAASLRAERGEGGSSGDVAADDRSQRVEPERPLPENGVVEGADVEP